LSNKLNVTILKKEPASGGLLYFFQKDDQFIRISMESTGSSLAALLAGASPAMRAIAVVNAITPSSSHGENTEMVKPGYDERNVRAAIKLSACPKITASKDTHHSSQKTQYSAFHSKERPDRPSCSAYGLHHTDFASAFINCQ